MKRRVLVGLALGAAALVLALWGVPLSEIGDALARARLRWLIPVALLFFVQQSLRALRQSLLLTRPDRPLLSFRRSLSVLCISFLFINTLPARLGEIVRPTLLWEREGVPLGRGVGMVVFERVLDLISAIGMLALVALFVPAPSRVLVVQGREVDWVGLGQTAAGVVLPVLLMGLVLLLALGRPLVGWGSQRVGRLPTWLVRPVRLVLAFAEGFAAGLDAARSPRRLAAVLGLTALTWSLSGFMFVCGAHAFHAEDRIGYGEGIGLLSITMLGTIVPSAPGFAGTYEAFLRGGLALFGVSGPGRDADAVAFALTYHWWVYGVQACTAIYFLVVDQVSPGRLWRKAVEGWRGAGDSADT